MQLYSGYYRGQLIPLPGFKSRGNWIRSLSGCRYFMRLNHSTGHIPSHSDHGTGHIQATLIMAQGISKPLGSWHRAYPSHSTHGTEHIQIIQATRIMAQGISKPLWIMAQGISQATWIMAQGISKPLRSWHRAYPSHLDHGTGHIQATQLMAQGISK